MTIREFLRRGIHISLTPEPRYRVVARPQGEPPKPPPPPPPARPIHVCLCGFREDDPNVQHEPVTT